VSPAHIVRCAHCTVDITDMEHALTPAQAAALGVDADALVCLDCTRLRPARDLVVVLNDRHELPLALDLAVYALSDRWLARQGHTGSSGHRRAVLRACAEAVQS